jgi:hypothetical protein
MAGRSEDGPDADDGLTHAGPARRAATRRFLTTLALAVAGLVLAIAADGTASIAGWTVVGVAATLAISLVFFEVGLSEDRARAREQRPAAGGPQPGRPAGRRPRDRGPRDRPRGHA